MTYKNIEKGIFIKRPNRFIAHVLVNGKRELAHVKNTGRCKEILINGATVFLEESHNPNRKTKYSLISVYKKGNLINIDSQVPNKIVKENLIDKVDFLKPEATYKNSRLDFYFENNNKKAYMEVKGVTLEKDGIGMFPDAPTIRGVKHIYHLIDLQKNGYDTYLVFIIKLKGIKIFKPNNYTHPEFSEALKKAKKAGVILKAFDCIVEKTKITLDKEIKIILD